MRILITKTVLLLAGISAQGQGNIIYDQQSSDEGNIAGSVGIQAYNPGQSFTPSLSGVGFIRLIMQDAHFGNSKGATVYVNLRSDSITGSIIASTESVFMADGFFGPTNFFFSSEMPVTPGITYYFEPIVQSGGDAWNTAIYTYNYSGGMAFELGAATPGSDLWFREGTVVQEPSLLSLVLVGSVLLACASRKHAPSLFAHARYLLSKKTPRD